MMKIKMDRHGIEETYRIMIEYYKNNVGKESKYGKCIITKQLINNVKKRYRRLLFREL